MIGVLAGWGFAVFLYLKIALDAAFYSSVSVLASLLMAILFGLLIFFLSGVYALKLARYNVTALVEGRSLGKALGQTILPFLGASIIYVIVCRLVIFGFSKDLSEDLEVFGYRNQLNEDFIIFALIALLPLLLHYSMVLFSARRMATE